MAQRATNTSDVWCPGSAAIGDRIFVIGGFDDAVSTNAVDIFDVRANTRRPGRPMSTGRRLLKVAELGGRLFAVGGVNDKGECLRTVERYDPDADAWQPVTLMTAGRGNPGVVAVGGRIYAVAGAGQDKPLTTSEVYSPAADRWELLEAFLPVKRASLAAARDAPTPTQPDVIIAIGGFEGVVGNARPSNRVEALAV
jgi:hypothetical protein